MAQLYYQVIAYLEANGKTKDDFSKVELVNNSDGAGDIIETWNVDGLAKPTEEQLTSLDAQATTDYNNFKVIKTRKKEYPSIEECVHAILDDDLENLQILRQAVKEKFPKT